VCSIRLSVRSYAASGTSTLRSVISGVPQGSVLGPILFLIYINDIVDLFRNSDVSTKLFAHDIKIYLELTSEADYSTLQKSIKKFFDWSKTWQLKLANDKCQHNHVSLSTAACRNAYFVSDAKLPIVQNVRDLGVLVDNRLTFRDHINSIVYDHTTRGHSLKLFVPSSRVNCRQHFFTVRVIDVWRRRRRLCKTIIIVVCKSSKMQSF